MTDTNQGSTIKRQTWKDAGFDATMKRNATERPYIAGESFDIRLDDISFNRVLQFRGLAKKPQGNDPGKVYYDPVTKKLKMWIDSIGQWAEVLYTTTSISTSTTSSSSSSTSTTSSSSSSSSSTSTSTT